ncbi:uncharacterized protein ACO6RY_12297 [Pungitius sinensis]
MMCSAHSSTIVGSSPALKCRCDTGDQSAAASRRTATHYSEVINGAPQTAFHPPPPSSTPSHLRPLHNKRQRKEGGWKEQMSVCALSCQVGPERGSHRHKGPNGVTKDVQEAPLRLGEPQRGSPFSASLHGHLQHEPERGPQSHVLPAGMTCKSTLKFNTNINAPTQECAKIGQYTYIAINAQYPLRSA